jgi:hypothetical protein
MEKNNLYKLALYIMLIASTTTLALAGHDYWAVAMFILIFSVK